MRHFIRQQYLQTTDSDRAQWSDDICRDILSDARIKEARCVMAFYPLNDEPDITPLLDKFLSEGKTVLLPVVINAQDMTLRIYKGDGNMETGALHTCHPNGEDFTEYSLIDAILVPGQAFDSRGHRLGRGKGYYDRFLQKLGCIYKRGVRFPYQKVESVPYEPHDIIIDHV